VAQSRVPRAAWFSFFRCLVCVSLGLGFFSSDALCDGAEAVHEGAGAAAQERGTSDFDQTSCVDTSSPSSQPVDGTSQPGIGTIAWKDTIGILTAPASWSGKNWLLFSGTVAAVAALGFVADVRVRKFSQNNKSAAADEFTKVVEPFGSQYSYAVLGAYGIAGFLLHDAPAKDIAIDGAMTSILAAGIITPVSKFVIGRSRPYQNEGPNSFHPFNSGYSSFPSGHATQAFAVASVISAHSDNLWVNISAYTLASFVGYARIYHDAHWVSDISAGALIGTAVGHAVVAINTRLRKGDKDVRIALTPFVANGRGGAGLAISF
jgi:membrane-associated phospholipid phosphatase